MTTEVDFLTADLPDPESARRFLASMEEKHPRDAAKLKKNEGLLSDALTLAAYSPLLATTLLQNPDYLWWLNRKRRAPAVRTKDDMLEALGRFVLTHSQLDLHTQLARFRRRELLRVFLGDIRRLATIAEITEDISNLADAILETALRGARQEMDNRFGQPQVVDEKGRKTAAEFCIVSLGKLGSHELNYSSDIDLLFLYSAEGETSGRGTRGAATNREYFVKLGEAVTQLVGKQAGEGAAYRIDMRLRPHGRVGPLAISVGDAVRYYKDEAHDWERQVLIRSRSSAGDAHVYKRFFEEVEGAVFRSGSDDGYEGSPVVAALENVRRSKQLIDREQKPERGFNVKLGRGGIREIEFIAQALQLAYGGDDRWLRAPHTLISLSRLADRGLISEAELTELFDAYEFLRRLEHVLQMENGLQTHTVPDEIERRRLIARRMRCKNVSEFDEQTRRHTENVQEVFERVFGSTEADPESEIAAGRSGHLPIDSADPTGGHDLERHAVSAGTSPAVWEAVGTGRRQLYLDQLNEAIRSESDFRHRLGVFRRRWSQLLEEIKTGELENDIDIRTSKREQTALAEASIDVALDLVRHQLQSKYKSDIERLALAVMGLGKLGGGAIDYGSDLDLVLVYDDDARLPENVTPGEFYSRAAEIFVTTLSSMTRDGSIYRVDLRLRPYGKNGTSTISAAAFREYMREKAAPWEWLAYVKIRAVAGDRRLAERVERDIREIIFSRANSIEPAELADETKRMRLLLEKERGGRVRSKDVDIKYGSGGMLDVYFAMRYLQLRDGVPDSADDRSTDRTLGVLHDRGSITHDDHDAMLAGYRFLSALDHHLRLTVGRTTRLPAANVQALDRVASRMRLDSSAEMLERLTIHRLDLRNAFDHILSTEV
jgi:glutamine synthetase adenylyltransferase